MRSLRDPQLKIAFADAGVSVVLMTDRPAGTLLKLLGQFKSTAGKAEHARWVLQAVLALKASLGKPTIVQHDPAADVSSAVRDDRIRAARLAARLLESVAAAGIAHPSTRIVERLRAASVAAEAARFPRLARLLRSVGDDASLQIARDAAADPTRLRERMVAAHALAQAAARPENAERIDLFGRSRTTYTAVGELRLHGLGAYGWRTASGFEGLTTLFWDDAGQRFFTATAARGEGQDRTFSIYRAYAEGLGWSGGAAVVDVCRRRLTLQNAKVNVDGRLSGAETCAARLDEPTDASQLNFGAAAIHAWRDLPKIAQQSRPIGLKLPAPAAAYVVIRPAHWGERWFDELHQEFVWALHDETGAVLEIRIPWSEVDEESVVFLESLKVERDKVWAVLGRVEVRRGALSLYPFSLFSEGTIQNDTILCPQFDQSRIRSRNEALLRRLRKKFQRRPAVNARVGDGDSDESVDEAGGELTGVTPLLQDLVYDVNRLLMSVLEAGALWLMPHVKDRFEQLGERLRSLGVTPLADSLKAALDAQPPALPNAILVAAYRLQLFRQSLRLSLL